MERAVILTRGPILQIPVAELRLAAGTEAPRPTTLEASERDAILPFCTKPEKSSGGPLGAAVRLGVKRTTLTAKMRRLGIRRGDLWHHIAT